MSGASVKRQVMEALDAAERTLDAAFHQPVKGDCNEARYALAPCVVLSPEEAAELKELATRDVWINSRALALLTPESEVCGCCNGVGCAYCSDEEAPDG